MAWVQRAVEVLVNVVLHVVAFFLSQLFLGFCKVVSVCIEFEELNSSLRSGPSGCTHLAPAERLLEVEQCDALFF